MNPLLLDLSGADLGSADPGGADPSGADPGGADPGICPDLCSPDFGTCANLLETFGIPELLGGAYFGGTIGDGMGSCSFIAKAYCIYSNFVLPFI